MSPWADAGMAVSRGVEAAGPSALDFEPRVSIFRSVPSKEPKPENSKALALETVAFNPRRVSSKKGPHRRIPLFGSNCPSSEMAVTTALRPTKISAAWQRVFAAGPK